MVIGSSANQIVVSSNNFMGNTINIANSGSGNITVNNAGYNSQGHAAGTSTGASGSVITAGSAPETHYIYQTSGFTAAVAKCTTLACGTSTNICTVSSATVPCVIQLGPNESYKVTWSSPQPTYTKDLH
jgi:hypothetical protein